MQEPIELDEEEIPTLKSAVPEALLDVLYALRPDTRKAADDE